MRAIENNYFDIKTEKFLIDELIRNFPDGKENFSWLVDNIKRGVLTRMDFFDNDDEIRSKVDELKRLLSRQKHKQ